MTRVTFVNYGKRKNWQKWRLFKKGKPETLKPHIFVYFCK